MLICISSTEDVVKTPPYLSVNNCTSHCCLHCHLLDCHCRIYLHVLFLPLISLQTAMITIFFFKCVADKNNACLNLDKYRTLDYACFNGWEYLKKRWNFIFHNTRGGDGGEGVYYLHHFTPAYFSRIANTHWDVNMLVYSSLWFHNNVNFIYNFSYPFNSYRSIEFIPRCGVRGHGFFYI